MEQSRSATVNPMTTHSMLKKKTPSADPYLILDPRVNAGSYRMVRCPVCKAGRHRGCVNVLVSPGKQRKPHFTRLQLAKQRMDKRAERKATRKVRTRKSQRRSQQIRQR